MSVAQPNKRPLAPVFQHPRAPVTFNPPIPDGRHQSVEPRYEVLTEDQIRLLDASEAVRILAQQLGSYQRLVTIVRNIAAIHGEEVR